MRGDRGGSRGQRRSDLVTHLLSRIPYKAPKYETVKLSKRHIRHRRAATDYPFKLVAERAWADEA